MKRARGKALKFVRALLGGASAGRNAAGAFAIGPLSLDGAEVRALISAGVLQGDAERCSATAEATPWLKRQMLEEDAFAAQHRIEARNAEGLAINLMESPLARLAAARPGEVPFLARHEVEAGERVRRLAERAQLQPRVTMSYSASHRAGGKGLSKAAEITDLAAEARLALAEIPRVLPRDCAGVVLDVCGLLKGLQAVESERGWPRRSAKLVLRIGLDQLARHYGLAPHAIGPASHRPRAWMGDGARPLRFE